MDGLLGLLLFTVLFFVMMRFGCGAHVMHRRHRSHGSGRDDAAAGAPSKDPVCGMRVAPEMGYAMSWGGSMYRFCSRQCLDRFEAEPASFARPVEQKT